MRSDKNSPPKKFIADLTEEELYAESAPVDNEKISDEPLDVDEKISEPPRRKTFHSKHFLTQDEDEKSDEPKVKQKISHAEAIGIIISVFMLGYSLFTEDKSLFFLSTALLIFLLRPLIGGLFGRHNEAVQNGLHAFSVALFVGALIFLFL